MTYNVFSGMLNPTQSINPWLSVDGQGTKWRRNIAEFFNRHKRYRQEHIANLNVSSRSLKMIFGYVFGNFWRCF